MKNIEIDFEVYKNLTMMRKTEEDSYNDVLRQLLNLEEMRANKSVPKKGKAFVSKGVEFPHGTKFRATYKGKNYFAMVENGTLVFDGKAHTSPSSAAIAVCGNSVNGWIFWECKFPGKGSWKLIKKLR